MQFMVLGSAFFRIMFTFLNASLVEDETTMKASWVFSLSEGVLSRLMFELIFYVDCRIIFYSK